MPSARLILFVALLLVASAPAVADTPALEEVIPADTGMVVLVRDLPGLRHDMNQSPWITTWDAAHEDGSLAAALGVDNWPEIRALLGLGMGDGDAASQHPFLELLSGQVALLMDTATLLDGTFNSEETHQGILT